jgi:hypothetical protein
MDTADPAPTNALPSMADIEGMSPNNENIAELDASHLSAITADSTNDPQLYLSSENAPTVTPCISP